MLPKLCQNFRSRSLCGLGLLCALMAVGSGCPPKQPRNQSQTLAPSETRRLEPTGSGGRTEPQSAAPTAVVREEVIATVGDVKITRVQLEQPLFEAYGLNMLAKVAQLELAKKGAAARGIAVTPQDVQAETDRYVANLFNEERDRILRELNAQIQQAKDSNDTQRVAALTADLRRQRNQLLDQLLTQQKISRADFELVMETNTYLRKIAEGLLKEQPLSEDALRAAFNHLYGEKVQVRDIQVASNRELTEVKRRLALGEPFDKVARELSRDPQSAPIGGELPPFSRDTPGYVQVFKDVAFTLKVGEVGEAQTGPEVYHLIKLEARIPPKVVKFEDVQDGVREFLSEKQLEATVRDLRATLQRDVLQSMSVNDPILKKQFEEQIRGRESDVRDRDEVRREMELNRPPATSDSETPATAPAEPSPAQPTSAPAGT